MTRKMKSGWRKLTLEQKVTILHLLLHKNLTRFEIAEQVGCSTDTVSKVRREYCVTVITKVIILKPEKKQMAKFVKALSDEPPLI